MSKTLLLADDSVVIQKLVGLSFASEDVEIVATDNGDDAVTRVRSLRPDVVLADVVMPGKSGYEVCEAIKQDPALAHIPVLLLTGTFEAFDENRASAAGADGHITKPFEAQALVERVKAVIQNATVAAGKSAASPTAAPAAALSATAVSMPATNPAPTRMAPIAAAPATPILDLDDDLFEAEAGRSDVAPPREEFLGPRDSLDVTPSLSEDDLGDALETDFFGPAGEVGDPSLTASRLVPSVDPVAVPAGEDATIAILPEPSSPRLSSPIVEALTDDLGLDDPIEIPEISAAAFDLDASLEPSLEAATGSLLDSSTDSPRATLPEPASAAARPAPRAAFGLVDDDALATTSRGHALVTDLDELLATPRPAAPGAGRPIANPAVRAESIEPESPHAVDFGPAERSGTDFDFGFDVSEQATVSRVDLLEQSFSSLLDVSEAQLLADPTPPPIPPRATPRVEPAPPLASPPPSPRADALDLELDLGGGASSDFDVSSSDLATSISAFAPPTPRPAPSAPAAASPTLESAPSFAASSAASATPATPASSSTAAKDAVAHMSPILQQQVQETLEKVAWEAFSDLSETIVKQVIERIERIAWEVIPQMAETLVREEIRKLKGEED